MRVFRNFTLTVIIAFCVASCIKVKTLPDEPRIEYKSFIVFDTTDILGNNIKGGKLKFYFEDGDGDLGLPNPTADSEDDSVNLFFTLYRMTNGVISPAPADDPLTPFNYRIPYMTSVGQNKILQGTISVLFEYYDLNKGDTIKYEFYVKDRDENLSNTCSTSIIPVYYNGTYTEIISSK